MHYGYVSGRRSSSPSGRGIYSTDNRVKIPDSGMAPHIVRATVTSYPGTKVPAEKSA